MKKVIVTILFIAALVVSFVLAASAVSTPSKKDTVKKTADAAKKQVEKPVVKPEYKLDPNKPFDVMIRMSTSDIYLLQLDDIGWYEMAHSQQITALVYTTNKERLAELRKILKQTGDNVIAFDVKNFSADTAKTVAPIPKGKQKPKQ